MSLNQKEKFIHIYAVVSILGKVNGEPTDVVRDTVAVLRQERCRGLTNREIEQIIDDIEEDTLGCSNAMDYILDEMEPQSSRSRIH